MSNAKKDPTGEKRFFRPGFLLRLFGRTTGTGAQGSGSEWERFAAGYLREKGLSIIERNARLRCGEIDIIASDGDEIVFVEVKARKTRDFGGAEYAIDSRKRRRLVAAAKEFLQRERLSGRPCRFDVFFVLTGVDPPEVTHIENAFGEEIR